jgi:hypothetical protein
MNYPSNVGIDDLCVTPRGEPNTLETLLAHANDRDTLADPPRTDAEQEAEVARLFSLAGIEVEFVN